MPTKKTSDSSIYTKPEVRERIKKEVRAGSKGGESGQWSARKAQLLAAEYEKEGGEYKKAPGKEQKSLQQWGEKHSSGASKKTSAKKKVAKKPSAAKK